MRISTENRIGKSYEYRAICDSCGWKYWNWELRQRWDGLWVCKYDWENRHESDFYRTRNDTHKLPFYRSDTSADPESSWVPTIANLTQNVLDAEVQTTINASSPTGYYQVFDQTSKTRAVFNLTFTKPSFSDATINLPVKESVSTTTSTAATFTLPTVPGSAGTCTVINDRGELIASATVVAGNSTVTLPSWTKKRGSIQISCVYGT